MCWKKNSETFGESDAFDSDGSDSECSEREQYDSQDLGLKTGNKFVDQLLEEEDTTQLISNLLEKSSLTNVIHI